MSLTYYQTLGLDPTCTEPEIRKAFKALALELHPDKNREPRSGYEFGAAWDAYNCLINPETRDEYDKVHINISASKTQGDSGASATPQTDKPSKSLRKMQVKLEDRIEKAKQHPPQVYKKGYNKKLRSTASGDAKERHNFDLDEEIYKEYRAKKRGDQTSSQLLTPQNTASAEAETTKIKEANAAEKQRKALSETKTDGLTEEKKDELVELADDLATSKPFTNTKIDIMLQNSLSLTKKDRLQEKVDKKKALSLRDQKQFDDYKAKKAAMASKDPVQQYESYLKEAKEAQQEKENQERIKEAQREIEKAKRPLEREAHLEWRRQEGIRLADARKMQDQRRKEEQEMIDNMDWSEWQEYEANLEAAEEFKFNDFLAHNPKEGTSAKAIATAAMPKRIGYTAPSVPPATSIPRSGSFAPELYLNMLSRPKPVEMAEDLDEEMELLSEQYDEFWAHRDQASAASMKPLPVEETRDVPPSNTAARKSHIESLHHASALAYTQSALVQYGTDNAGTQLIVQDPVEQPPIPDRSEMEKIGFIYVASSKGRDLDMSVDSDISQRGGHPSAKGRLSATARKRLRTASASAAAKKAERLEEWENIEEEEEAEEEEER